MPKLKALAINITSAFVTAVAIGVLSEMGVVGRFAAFAAWALSTLFVRALG